MLCQKVKLIPPMKKYVYQLEVYIIRIIRFLRNFVSKLQCFYYSKKFVILLPSSVMTVMK